MERQHFTREELEHYQEAFKMYDTNDNGFITTKDLGPLIRYFCYSSGTLDHSSLEVP